MIGTREPAVRPLPAALADWAELVRSRIRRERIRADVEQVARPRNRLTAQDEVSRTERLIARTIGLAGWETERRPFAFRDASGLPVSPRRGACEERVVYERLEGVNVLGFKRGSGRGQAVLVGAHYDTVFGSPGADDNASGVGVLLELARVLAPFTFERDVLLAAFDLEEIGCFGSRALVDELRREQDVKAALVFESIGYTSDVPGSQSMPPGVRALYPHQVRRLARRGLRGDWTLVIYRRSSLPAARAFGDGLAHLAGRDAVMLMRDPLDIPIAGRVIERIAPWARDFARSDHVEFWRAGIPAVQITDTADFRNPHYHQPTDTPETLDYERLETLTAATAIFVAWAARPVTPSRVASRQEIGRDGRPPTPSPVPVPVPVPRTQPERKE